ncbi:MAG TPA: 50S ribosomal protein L11 methyltransferase [Burkholderiaceae bacterium]|nr:50S ribosomal protein L11 methyltransferase [Burkholderiaceae bacterium]
MLTQFTVTTDASTAEALSDALLRCGALAVAVDDADAETPHEEPLFGEPGATPPSAAWRRNRLEVLCGDGADPGHLLARASELAGTAVPAIESHAEVADADWVRQTQSQFPPTRIADRLWIVPSWHEPPDPAALNVRIDPGAAFGTGTHPTTRLCLAWLEAEMPRNASLLDYGCGSGILSISAALLGAREAVGTDIDPGALEVARDNAKRNGAGSARYTSPDALTRSSPPDGFDVVVANILSAPLVVLAPALVGRVRPGGALVLSGILASQAEAVGDAYRRVAPRGIELAPWREDEGWVCLVGHRAESGTRAA